jgi:hypothetical protein
MTFTQVPALRQIIAGLFPIALPGPVKNSLWARYQALLSKHGPDATRGLTGRCTRALFDRVALHDPLHPPADEWPV